MLITREAGARVIDIEGAEHAYESRTTIAATASLAGAVAATIDAAKSG